MDARTIPEPVRRDLLSYLLASSADRARIVARVYSRNPSMGDLLADLEADEDLRARFGAELLRTI